MTITREQVADLRPGDVVRLVRIREVDRYTYQGPVRTDGGDALAFDDWWIRDSHGNPPEWCESLTVVFRAPRPLYVNHYRAEPVNGDVVRDCDGDAWSFVRDEWWCASPEACDDEDPDGYPIENFRPLTLLLDGDTGQVVP